MSDRKEKKTYTIKQIIIALLPYLIILLIALPTIGGVIGWTMRSNFAAEVQTAATQDVQDFLKAQTPQK